MTREDLTALGIQGAAVDAILQLHMDGVNAAVGEVDRRYAEERFNKTLDDALNKARANNLKAAKALLDLDALKASENQDVAIQHAVDNLVKQEHYLFSPIPPPYAAGTGSSPVYFRRNTLETAFRDGIGLNGSYDKDSYYKEDDGSTAGPTAWKERR